MVGYRAPQLDRVFHALAHPARRAILRRLSLGQANLSELAAPLKMSFPAARKHVAMLERAKLIHRRRVGRTHVCRLSAQPLSLADHWLEETRRIWEANFQRLDAVLENLAGLERVTKSKVQRTP